MYGVSAWDVKLDGAVQRNLIITPPEQPKIEVDNLEIAQFIYLILHDHKVRQVIDSIKSKVVLILGRFTPGRKAVLEATVKSCESVVTCLCCSISRGQQLKRQRKQSQLWGTWRVL